MGVLPLLVFIVLSQVTPSVYTLFYQANDPCRYMTYDYLTQLCCNGVVYVDTKFLYTCCGSKVCFAVNRTLANPSKLQIVTIVTPTTTAPYATQAQQLLAQQLNSMLASLDLERKSKPAQFLYQFKPPTKPTTTTTTIPVTTQQQSYMLPRFQPIQFVNYPAFGNYNFSETKEWPFAPLPFFAGGNFGNVQHNIVPLTNSPTISLTTPPQTTPKTGLPFPISTMMAPLPMFGNQQNPYIQHIQPQVVPLPNIERISQPDIYCDGINLSELRATNPNLACCANMVVYDVRSFSCNKALNGAISIVSTTMEPPPPTTLPTTIPTTLPTPMPTTVTTTTTTMATTTPTTTTSTTILPPLTTPTTTFPVIRLPRDFMPIICYTHVYYLEPSIAGIYKCCGEDVQNVRAEYCHQAFFPPHGQFRVIPLDPTRPTQRVRLDCGSTTTYVFSSMESSSPYSC